MWITTLSILLIAGLAQCQNPIPNRPLGFVYNASMTNGSNVVIDLYLDLACPDSKAAFPVMKQVSALYAERGVKLNILIFPLPYHHTAWTGAVGVQAAYNNPVGKQTPEESAIAWMDLLFARQISWSNGNTYHKTQQEVESLLAGFSSSLGYDEKAFQGYLRSSTYDWNSRVMWKYACSRGVSGTPWFFINDIQVEASMWTTAQWKDVIDKLLQDRFVLAMK